MVIHGFVGPQYVFESSNHNRHRLLRPFLKYQKVDRVIAKQIIGPINDAVTDIEPRHLGFDGADSRGKGSVK
jgi:hypothetical protein